MPEYIAIGDIHGMNNLLDELLACLPPSGELVFLGDYIDRGTGSKETIDRLLALRKKRHCHFLRGNHEAMLLSALDGNDEMRQFWLRNGGVQTLESYQGRVSDEHVNFLKQTQPYLVTEKYIFVHAGLVPGIPIEKTGPEDFLWIREPFLSTDYNWGRPVIHGHTPMRLLPPEIRANRINVDTGAVFGGALTAVILPETTFISVPPVHHI